MPISLEKPQRPSVATEDLILLPVVARSSAPEAPGNCSDVDLPDCIGNDRYDLQKSAKGPGDTQHTDARASSNAAQEATNRKADTSARTAWLETVRALARATARSDHAAYLSQVGRDGHGHEEDLE